MVFGKKKQKEYEKNLYENSTDTNITSAINEMAKGIIQRTGEIDLIEKAMKAVSKYKDEKISLYIAYNIKYASYYSSISNSYREIEFVIDTYLRDDFRKMIEGYKNNYAIKTLISYVGENAKNYTSEKIVSKMIETFSDKKIRDFIEKYNNSFIILQRIEMIGSLLVKHDKEHIYRLIEQLDKLE